MHTTQNLLLFRGVKTQGRRLAMTLLEITFVLLIMVAIVGGALVMASSTMSQSNAVQEAQTVTNLAGAVRKVRMAGGYPTDIGDALVDMGYVPANVPVAATGEYTNAWGGEITFETQASGAHFGITYDNVPLAECRQLVSSVKSGILQSVGNAYADRTNLVALDITRTNAICSDANANTIHWSTDPQ